MKSTYLALLAVLLSPLAANADPISIDFSFDEDGSSLFGGGTPGIPVPGTVMGTIFGLQDNMASQMAGIVVVINSFPIGLGGVIDNGLDTSLWEKIFGTGFDVFGGVLTGANYVAEMGDDFPGSGDQIRLNWGGGNINSLTFDGYVTSTGNDDGFQAVTYTATTVPEPGTLALLGIGLFGMGLARRRRKT